MIVQNRFPPVQLDVPTHKRKAPDRKIGGFLFTSHFRSENAQDAGAHRHPPRSGLKGSLKRYGWGLGFLAGDFVAAGFVSGFVAGFVVGAVAGVCVVSGVVAAAVLGAGMSAGAVDGVRGLMGESPITCATGDTVASE